MAQEKNQILNPSVADAVAAGGNIPFNNGGSAYASHGNSDFSYEIKGENSQYVEIKLNPGKSIIGEIKALLYYEAGIKMKIRTSLQTDTKKSFVTKLLGIGKAALNRQTIFMMHFTNVTQKQLIIAFSMPYSGTVMPIDLNSVGNKLICQNESLLCSSSDLIMALATPQDIGSTFLMSSISMQKIEGRGTLFLFCGGSLVQKTIVNGSPLHVTTGSILALQKGVKLTTKTIMNVGLTGQAHSLTELSGAGLVWVQSLPYKRVKDTLIEHVRGVFGLKPKRVNPIWGNK
jgi:uncharacterized protein (AIM24 family)